MKMELNRRFKGPEYTIGSLILDGVYFCDTIEDQVRDIPKEGKIQGKTAIPAGTYDVELSLSPKFKRLLPMIMDVPYFTGIRIHRGNTAEDSHGCILPGENKEKGKVLYSTLYETNLIKRMKEVIERGEEITIEIK